MTTIIIAKSADDIVAGMMNIYIASAIIANLFLLLIIFDRRSYLKSKKKSDIDF